MLFLIAMTLNMTELDTLIQDAFAQEGRKDITNKFYLLFLRTNLLLPVKKDKNPLSEEPFEPLFANIEGRYYLPVFDTLERLSAWAGEEFAAMQYVDISGHDLILGISEAAFLCLNLGTPFYKEFAPDEIMHLKKIVARIAEMKAANK
jgi:hypothetical protein